MNNVKNEKYGLSHEEIEKKSLFDKRFKTIFNVHRIEKIKLLHDRLKRCDDKKYSRKRRKLRENLYIGKKVLVLAERIKKKSAPGKFYKQSVQNIVYFNRERTFSIRNKKKIDKINYYWLTDLKTGKNMTKRFQRNELLALLFYYVNCKLYCLV